MLHVQDDEAEPLLRPRGEEEPGPPGRLHRVSECEVEQQAERPPIRLVGGEQEERLGRSLLELHLGDRRPRPAHVAGEGVIEEVLPSAVQALCASSVSATNASGSCPQA